MLGPRSLFTLSIFIVSSGGRSCKKSRFSAQLEHPSRTVHDRSAIAMLLQVPCSQWIDERMLSCWRKPSALEKRSIEEQIPFRAIFTIYQP